MPDSDASMEITVIVDKPCWSHSPSYWENLIQPAIQKAFHEAKWFYPSEVNVLLTDKTAIQELNKNHRGFDKPTNVLSFPSLEPGEIAHLSESHLSEPIILGDIALSFETIQAEAQEQDKPFEHHLIHLVVHGGLHLLGFDHEDDEEAAMMESLEIKILSSLGILNPY